MGEVKAYAVVCASGAIHVEEGDEDKPQDWYLRPVRWPVSVLQIWIDDRPKLYSCGPHRVVLLRGTLPKGERKPKS